MFTHHPWSNYVPRCLPDTVWQAAGGMKFASLSGFTKELVDALAASERF
ncbi:hypothetical protein [Undibacterium sp. Ji22W]